MKIFIVVLSKEASEMEGVPILEIKAKNMSVQDGALGFGTVKHELYRLEDIICILSPGSWIRVYEKEI